MSFGNNQLEEILEELREIRSILAQQGEIDRLRCNAMIKGVGDILEEIRNLKEEVRQQKS